MITVIDDKINPGRAVRCLLYTDASELTGEVLNTSNGGTVTCLPGSVAFKAGFTDMKQLDHNGEWQDC